MFDGCSSLKEIKIKNFDTKNAVNMEHMFCECSSLVELEINNFDINKALIKCMFFGCSEKLRNKIKILYSIDKRVFECF